MARQYDNTLPVLTHVLALLTGFLGPLVILFVATDEKTKNHARLALNWQFSLLIYSIVSAILIIILVGFVFLIVLALLNLVFCITAAVKAAKGELWHYHMTIPFFQVE